MDLNKLYLMDCMEGMKEFPDNYFNLAIVDPPYGIGLDFTVKNGMHDSIHKSKSWNNNTPTKEYFVELHRVSKHQIIWGCNYYARYIPAVGRIIHDKQMSCEYTAINFSHGDIASCSRQKRITFFRYEWSGNRQNGKVNWKNTGDDKRIHPTQKPIALYKWLLKNHAKPGDKILDTHAGSCSSVIACIDGGFDWIAFELDPDYYQAAVKRINNHKRQGDIFNEKKEENIQTSII